MAKTTKSIRDMTDKERRRFSLKSRVSVGSVVAAIVVGIITMFVTLGLYMYSLVVQSVSTSFATATGAAIFVSEKYDVGSLMGEVMDIYRGLSAEERQDTDDPAYMARFAHLEQGDEYSRITDALAEYRDSANLDGVYIAHFDRETQAIVYLYDTDKDPDTVCHAGRWESVPQREIDKFFNWNGRDDLYDIGYTEDYGLICTSAIPIYNSLGEIEYFVLVDTTLNFLFGSASGFLILFMTAFIILIVILGLVISRRMDVALVAPVEAIASAARRYAETRIPGASEENYFGELNIHTGNELEELSLVMTDMENSLRDYEADLTRITAERERVHTEMTLATRIQADMLPNTFPAFPERPEFEIYATMEPARDVGGDFYNYFLIDDDHICLMMADVAGKGIPAALFMMASMILLSDRAQTGSTPADILHSVNEIICGNNREEMFVTVWLGILELSTGKVIAANAGHEYPVISDADGHFEILKDKHGFVLGGMSGMKYRDYEFTMEHGSRLFLYTDGVTEATSADGELFGTDRMLDALNSEVPSDPMQVLSNVRQAIREFTTTAEQFDDLTMMCIEYA